MGLKANNLHPSLPSETTVWRSELSTAFRSVNALLEFLQLKSDEAPYYIEKNLKFPFLVTRHFAELMIKKNWGDPLLLQVLPRGEELQNLPGYTADAVGDGPAQVLPGLLHKYKNRVLLTPTSACSIHCRYCFRKEFPYQPLLTQSRLQKAIDYISESNDVDEVIFSGGDPLMLDDLQLENILQQLASIPQLKRFRFHTRTLSTLPSRITDGFAQLCTTYSQSHTIVVVFHINHPQEIDTTFQKSVWKLRQTPALLYNQSVLLRNVNDHEEMQTRLQLKLLETGISPYYLHQLDRVHGTHHFEVPQESGEKIMAALRKDLPGYGVPKYVKEEPSKPSKTLLI